MIMKRFFLIFAVALSIAGAVLASQKSTHNEDEMIMASVEALSNDEVVVGNTGPAKEKKCSGGQHRMVCMCENPYPCTGTDCY